MNRLGTANRVASSASHATRRKVGFECPGPEVPLEEVDSALPMSNGVVFTNHKDV